MAQIALIALAAGASGYQAYQAHETKQEQKAALAKSEELQQNRLKDKKKKIIASQKANLLASGISLSSGLADVMFEDTQLASQEESNLIADYYETQISNVNRTARGQYASAIGSFGKTAVSSWGS